MVRYRDGDGILTKAVSPETIRTAFLNEPIDSGWLTPEVRRWGHTPAGQFAVMFIPAQKHTLRITNLSKAHSKNGRVRIEVPLPALVFAGLGDKYALWAVAEDLPTPKARVYRAPLPNVDANGRICWGNNTPPLAAPDTLAQAWKLFITSPFNNHMMGGASQEFNNDVREQLIACESFHSYPIADLVPHGKHTVNSTVHNFLEN